MKKIALSLILFAVCSISLFGQEYFEGKIKFGISLEGENAEEMAPLMPNSYEYQVKGLNMRYKINGGVMAAMMGEFYILGEVNEIYMVNHSAQTAYKFVNEGDHTPTSKTAYKKLDETLNIQGYNCQKYQVTVLDAETGEEATQYMWVTQEIKMKPMETSQLKVGGDVFLDGLEGFPLKIITQMEGMSMVLTATQVEKKTLSASLFKIPEEYSIEKFDMAAFGY